jgi:thioesterase domain-containing protein
MITARSSRARLYFTRNAGGSRAPLFYLHGDFDGGGLYCLALASHLGLDQPLYALNPYGTNGEPLPASISAMAAAHIETMLRLVPADTYRLAGHCNGGLIAFEMARQLVARGLGVDRLIVIATRADYWKVKPLPGTAAYYVNQLRHWWNLDATGRRHEIVRFVRACARLSGPEAAPSPEEHSPLFYEYRRLMAAYRPGRFDGRVTVLWPDGEMNRLSADPTMGWSEVASRLELELVPGEHLTCLTDHVPALAAALRRHLD